MDRRDTYWKIGVKLAGNVIFMSEYPLYLMVCLSLKISRMHQTVSALLPELLSVI